MSRLKPLYGGDGITKTKSAGLAAVFSFVIPGLGQIYNGQFGKAVGFILGAIIFGALFPTIVGAVLFFALWIWAILDAYHAAETMNVVGSPKEIVD
ncbi:MAG: hypothetical protein LHV69_08335 [Elusimicrobia bacterium]|nr:hypothetical protein [Candidatus Obscuribacterium magneticum]